MSILKKTPLLLIAPAMLWAESAAAQSQPALEEVVVTAQRTSENLQSVPLSVSAISGEALQRAEITSTAKLSGTVPGLVFTQSAGVAAAPYLRGIGQYQASNGTESPVSMYLDGVYMIALPSGIQALNNVQRLEVLKGPQGTLFGRNAVGGVIQIITKDPSATPTLSADVSYGNYNAVAGHFYAASKVAENLKASVAAYGLSRDAFGRNLYLNVDQTPTRSYAGQTKWVWTPDDKTAVTLNLLGSNTGKLDARGVFPGTLADDGVTKYVNPFDTYERTNNKMTSKYFQASLKGERQVGDVRVINILAYQYSNFAGTDEQNAVPGVNINPFTKKLGAATILTGGFTNDNDTVTEELQVQSDQTKDFRWVAGAFYLNNKAHTIAPLFSNETLVQHLDATLETTSWAGFAQATKTFFGDTDLTFGIRYTADHQDYSGSNNRAPVSPQAGGLDTRLDNSHPTFRVSLDKKFSEDLMAYASYNTGYRTGHFVFGNFSNPPVASETVAAYEFGLKTQWLDRRVRVNIAAFGYEYKNLQVKSIAINGINQTVNAAAARGRGVDVDFQALLTQGLTLSGGVELLPKAKFLSFPGAPCPMLSPTGGTTTPFCDLSGARMPYAPRVSGNLQLTYNLVTSAGRYAFTVADNYVSSYKFAPDNLLVQDAYSNVTASASWTAPSDRWNVTLFGSNLLDERIFASAGVSTTAIFIPGDPRLYGVRVGVNF